MIERGTAFVFRPGVTNRDDFLQALASRLPARYAAWAAGWVDALAACQQNGCETTRLRVGKPATAKRIARYEAKYARRMPDPLSAFFLNAAEFVTFSWHGAGQAATFGGQRVENPSGRLHVRLRDVIPVVRLDGWNPAKWRREEVAFLGDDAAEIRVLLENTTAFMAVGNGDYLVIDTRDGQVKYLSHDDPEAMGVVLGSDFEAFMTRWSALGCIGPEIWQLQPFLGPQGLCVNSGETTRP